MPIKDIQKKTADSSRVVQRGTYCMYAGRDLAIIRKLKFFTFCYRFEVCRIIFGGINSFTKG